MRIILTITIKNIDRRYLMLFFGAKTTPDIEL